MDENNSVNNDEIGGVTDNSQPQFSNQRLYSPTSDTPNNGTNNFGYYNGMNNTGYNTGVNNGPGVTSNQDVSKPAKKKKGIFKRVVAITLSAVLFGSVAGATMVGVYALGIKNNNLDKIGSEKTDGDSVAAVEGVSGNVQNGISSVTSNISNTTTVKNEGDESDTQMNYAAVAAAGLPAIVALQGTVTVSTGLGYGFGYESAVSGTGIIVGQNDTELLILTNAHVIEDVNNLKCVFVDEETVDCTVKGYKSNKDIAVVAVKTADIPSSTISKIAIAELGDSDKVKIGEEVVAIGNALGEGQSVTNGIISACNRSITVDGVTFDGLFMTNAAINSGNSGGALLDADGRVIAINFAKTTKTGVEGMAYSIPVSNVKELIDNLMNRETREKVDASEAGYFGISALDITSYEASQYGYPTGIQIRSIDPGSPADKAGLEVLDIIVSFDDQSVTSMTGFQNILQYYKAGETVKVEYYHIEGKKYVLKSVEVTLANKKS